MTTHDSSVYRHYSKRMPNILPRLLDAVKWQSRDEVSQLYLLLEDWQPVLTQVPAPLLYPKTKA